MEYNDWTYCGDGKNLPESGGFYLCSLSEEVPVPDDIAVVKCYFNEHAKSFMDYGRHVAAWMPLPERYRKP